MNKVIVRLSGGLGNQLFQIATAVSYGKAKLLPVFYYHDTFDTYARDFLVAGLLNRLGIFRLESPIDRSVLRLNDLSFYDPKILYDFSNTNSVMLWGSFQKWQYFYGDLDWIRPIVLEWLDEEVGLSKSEEMSPVNSIHLRLAHNRTKDNTIVNAATPLDPEFIGKVLNNLNMNSKIIRIVSDVDPKSPYFLLYTERIAKISKHLEFVISPTAPSILGDFYTLTQTRENLILSNSTFSVWASILNKRASIHAPYLRNLEKWAMYPPHVKQYYYDTRLFKHVNHAEVSLEPRLLTYSLLMRMVLKSLDYLSSFYPIKWIIVHLERHISNNAI